MAFDISRFAAERQTLARPRTIEVITHEILRLKEDAGNAMIGIGQRLIEAKDLLPHGEWLPWLSDQVGFSERTAQNFMRLAREWPNPQALADLGSSKAVALLTAFPDQEAREQFLQETHTVGGEEKSVSEMTTRELERTIRSRTTSRREVGPSEDRTPGARDVVSFDSDIDAFGLTLSQAREQINRLHGLFLKFKGRDEQRMAASVQDALMELSDMARKCAEKEGRWLPSEDNGWAMHKCSLCGSRVKKELYEYENPNKFCYHCGARMV